MNIDFPHVMYLLHSNGVRCLISLSSTSSSTSSPLIIGRGVDGTPDDICISREHTQLELVNEQVDSNTPTTIGGATTATPTATSSSSSSSFAVRLTQLGRHPVLVYREDDLIRIGWRKLQIDAAASISLDHRVTPKLLTRTQLEHRSERGLVIQKGESIVLHVGDAFGISTSSKGVQPFFIMRETTAEAAAASAAARSTSATSTALATPISAAIQAANHHVSSSSRVVTPVVTPITTPLGAAPQIPSPLQLPSIPSLSLTPSSRDSSPSRHASNASGRLIAQQISPSRAGSVVGPTSNFYQQVRTESVERALQQAIDADRENVPMQVTPPISPHQQHSSLLRQSSKSPPTVGGITRPPSLPSSTASSSSAMTTIRQPNQSEEDAMGMRARLDAHRILEEERLDHERQAREAAEWSIDQYPSAKRRKIVDIKSSLTASHLPAPAHVSAAASSSSASSSGTASSSASSTPRENTRVRKSPPTNSSPSTAAVASTATSSSSSAAASAQQFDINVIPSSLPTANVALVNDASAASSSSSSSTASSSTAPAPFPPPTLVLPPLSVLDFHFQTEKANPIAMSAIRTFLSKYPASDYPDARITLVIPGKDATTPNDGAPKEVYDFFQAAIQSHELDARFEMRIGDITDLASLGVRASYMVHPTTWRFIGGEGGRIAKYMPSWFAERLSAKYKEGAKIGWVHVTSVTNECELSQRCPGLTALMTLRPPNMNDERPLSLNGNYLKGCKELATTYSVLFLAMAAKLKPADTIGATPAVAAVTSSSDRALSPSLGTNGSSSLPPSLGSLPPSPNLPNSISIPTVTSPPMSHPPIASAGAAAASSSSSSTPTVAASSSAAASPTSSSFVPPTSCPPYTAPSGAPPKPAGHFSTILYEYIKQPRPSHLQQYVFWEDADFVVIYDVYPKARIHLLLLPKRQTIDSILNLTPTDLPLLAEMDARGRWLCDQLHLTDSVGRSIPLRRGFHAVPSLKLLHLHIISQEFDSVCMKNKKHWNSFVSSFFVQPNKLRELILQSQTNASASKATFFTPASARTADTSSLADMLRSGEKLLTGELRCQRVGCNTRMLNMSELKQHILKTCVHKPYPTQGV